MKKLIAYDLDGTLADTRLDIVHSVRHMLSVMEAPPLEASEIETCVGRGLHHLIRSTLKTEEPKRVERGAKIFREHYAQHMLDHTRLFDGAREVLEHFRGRKQAVLTNKPNPFSDLMLEGLGVRAYFVSVIAGDPGRPKKPDPAGFQELLAREGLDPREALYIGDSPVDIETGRRASVETVVITHGFTGENELKSLSPDHLVRSFGELLEKARALGW